MWLVFRPCHFYRERDHTTHLPYTENMQQRSRKLNYKVGMLKDARGRNIAWIRKLPQVS